MSLIVSDEGLKRILDLLTTGTGLGNIRIGLYQNNYTPVHTSVLLSFTPATFVGYAVVTPAFAAATVTAHVGTTIDAAARTFTCSGTATTNTIYGYYVYDSVGGVTLFAEEFSSPQTIANIGDQISLTSQFSLTSQY